MSKKPAAPVIRLRGVRHNNLKNFDLDLPQNQLIVITGLSGSGKSSLAFDTLFAEGQRRYIETFSPYARQFFDRMDKPQVDSIEGIPPAIAIEQRNSVKSTRSTVGTMTEICDHMKLLWPHVAQLHCRQCGQPVRKDSPQQIWESLLSTKGSGEFFVTFNLPVSERLSLDESLALISKQGYQRLLIENEILRIEDALPQLHKLKPTSLTIVQDRVKLATANRARFVEAAEQAYHFGKGKLAVYPIGNNQPSTTSQQLFSNRLHCASCDIEYREPTSALFSFNHPVGACPACRGFGRIITIDYNVALPDRSKTLAEGVVKPWQTGQSAECQADLMKFCRIRKAPIDVPFEKLSQKWQDWVVNGDPDYGKDKAHEWPRAWYGIKGYFRWLESKSYKMHVRVLLSRYRSYVLCPDCQGRRFQPESLLYKVSRDADEKLNLAQFYLLPIRDALNFVRQLATQRNFKPNDPLTLVVNEVGSRLGYLNEVGLGYLTLDRPTRSLSGGETERVNLTSCLGTRLVNTLFVLDEPSVGLHPRDTSRLVRILEQLRNAGNTVVVVEHEASVMRAADQLIDIGPGHGAAGGHVVFQGPYPAILKSTDSLTGQYLSGRREIPLPTRRLVQPPNAPTGQPENSPGQTSATSVALGTTVKKHNPPLLPPREERAGERRACTENNRFAGFLTLKHATLHNLNDVSVQIPLGRFVCLTGVSGSGKTTLAREILLPLLSSKFNVQSPKLPGATQSGEDAESDENSDDTESPSSLPQVKANLPEISGWDNLGRVVLVDQSALGKTPRSNPAVYIGAFDDIRELFALTELADQRGLGASAFSFNSSQGQCERCRGAGFEKIEMQFLSDIFIRCPECHGRRYRAHILEVKLASPDSASHEWSIADLLDATVDEVVAFLAAYTDSRHAQRALASLKLLQEVGLGYLRLGQPINTLSGGESQRLKLVRHLADFTQSSTTDTKPTLFVFDEPTTGLHFDDVRVLVNALQRLVDAGHSLLVIEHNLDVIKSADWIIDLGPDAGDEGGRVIAEGTPEAVAAVKQSHTGQALAEVL